jgi:hypothetical protein
MGDQSGFGAGVTGRTSSNDFIARFDSKPAKTGSKRPRFDSARTGVETEKRRLREAIDRPVTAESAAINSDPDRGYMGRRLTPALGTSVMATGPKSVPFGFDAGATASDRGPVTRDALLQRLRKGLR